MRWFAGCCLCWLASMAWCSAAEPVSPAAQFQQVLEQHWEQTLQSQPTFATHLGDKRYNDRWPDISAAGLAQRQQQIQDILAKLNKLDTATYPPEVKLNYRLLVRQLTEQVAEHEQQGYYLALTQREGMQDVSDTADVIDFRTVQDYEQWIKRLQTLPQYGQQTIELLRQGIKHGIIQPRIVMQRVPGQIRKQLVTDPTQSLYYKPFLKLPATLPEAERIRLQQAAQAAIQQHVLPFYRDFLKFFEEEYLPKCYEPVGAWQFPNGKEYYAQRVRHFTTTKLTADEIHDIGQAEVQRIRGEMHKIVKEVQWTGTFAEFLQSLRTEKKYYYQSSDELLAAYQTMCKRIDPELPRLFRKLPRIPYGVEPIPMHIAPDTTAAYYRPPAGDGTRAGMYFVNLYRPEMRPKYEMEALSLHEAVPGHHLQIALANEQTDLPPFRRHAETTVFVEGWALYAESLGSELGCYREPYSRFGQLTYEMWRAVRLVVDTGMHHKRWTRDQAIAFFREHTAKSELDIVNEVDRYISWPGQALAYKIGELRIKELRKQAESALGEQFDIREFHDVILRNGAIPLDVLSEQVTDWIQSKSQPNSSRK
jgi:uncharacterized protein (DUF885 family)